MNPERYKLIASIFAQARDVTGHEREHVLQERCGADVELRREVEEYLKADDARIRSALDRPAVSAEQLRSIQGAEAEDYPAGTIVGRYTIRERIGEGGFGNVYLAEQAAPVHRMVAIKIMKAGLDTKAVLARFQQEQQALAVMDHPNVARVFDGGETDNGRSYFVMEYVDGSPITVFCDKHRYTIRQRLELFISVCEAVQHAHMKGIIHRDIKPANILVGTQGERAVAKVIDFGIAKAISRSMTEAAVFTEVGHLIGTPEYMSPEQAGMGVRDIDTRTDVYSLGVVLYELLVGTLPFDATVLRQAGYVEIQRIIREVEPPRPSTRLSGLGRAASEIATKRGEHVDRLRGLLHRELEWIPLKAMRKDRISRYGSAADLAKDLRRYLFGEALEAGPEATLYRLRKTAGRYRGVLAAVAAVLVTLATGLGIALWQARIASAQRDAARELAGRESAAKAAAAAAKTRADERAAEAKSAREEAEYQSYVANIVAAEASLKALEADIARTRLDACEPSLRSWEWHWLDAMLPSSSGHFDGPIMLSSAPLSHNGSRILGTSGPYSEEYEARIFDADTGAVLVRLVGHVARVTDAAFDPSDSRVVTASEDQTARVWNADTGELLLCLTGHTSSVAMAKYSPDGALICTASGDHTVRIWDASNGALLTTLYTSGKYGSHFADFSPDGTQLVAVGDEEVRLWDLSTFAEVACLSYGRLGVHSATFSPDGGMLCVNAIDCVLLYDTESYQPVSQVATRTCQKVAFNSDGTLMGTAEWFGPCHVWNTRDGSLVASLPVRGKLPLDIAFSPDSQSVATAADDDFVRIWNTSSGTQRAVIPTSFVTQVIFSPDGERVLTAHTWHSVELWQVPALRESNVVKTTAASINTMCYSSDGRSMALAMDDNTIQLVSTLDYSAIAVLKGHTGPVRSLVFIHGDSQLISASDDGDVVVWDVTTATSALTLRDDTQTWSRRRKPVSLPKAVAISADGTVVAVAIERKTYRPGNDEGRVDLWDLRTRKRFGQLPIPWHVRSIALTADGASLIGAGLDDIILCEVRPKPGIQRSVDVSQLGRAFRGSLTCVVLNPTGEAIATANEDHTASVWDFAAIGETWSPRCVLSGHQGVVSSVSFNHDGTRLVTASNDGTARVWDSARGAQLVLLRSPEGPLSSALFSPDGSQIVTLSSSGIARVWDSVHRSHRVAKDVPPETMKPD
ncbi:MAG: hypothetical protein AMXMBFR58_29140 [Phycisphaerae bacterium]